MTDTKPSKKSVSKKTKGPLRLEAIVPLVIFIALISVYMSLFFDGHLRRFLVWGLELSNGAEVNINSLNTSFTQASITIQGIRMTDPESPDQNRLELGRIHFQLLWDGLLRGKLVIPDASIEGIQVASPRKTRGWVAPPDPPSKASSGTRIADKVVTAASDEFSGNVLGDIASVLQGVDPAAQLGNIEAQLKSSLQIKALEQEIQAKQKLWQQQINQLPQAKEFEELGRKLKNIKSDNFTTAQEVQTSLQQFQAVAKEAEEKVNLINSTSQSLNKDINKIQSDSKNIEKFIQQDIQDLERRLQIPRLDAGSLSKSFFGKILKKYTAKGEKYFMMAQAYMPPKKDKTQEAKSPPLTPQERARGINYAFGRPNSYPLFWLQRAAISSKAEHSPFSGELSGEMTHLSTDPQWVAEPFEIRIEGNFPSSNLNDLKIHGRFDHRNQNPTESVALSIGAYEVGPRLFSESPEVTFGILKAVGNLDLKASYAQGIVELKNHSLFKNISYQIESNQKEVKDILVGATNDIQVVTVDAKINGPWDTLSMAVTSNLGDAVEKAFRKQIQIRIEKAQRELREYVEKQIAGEKTRLEAELAKITGQVTSAVSQAQNQANQLKSQSEGNAQATQKNAEKKARQDLEKAGNKAMEDLKKRLKF